MSKSADAFRTISEVADWLGIPAHVLRFWESKFTQVKPVKRAGGRRYYRPADMQLLGGIRKLLHDDGMTIKGVQKIMRDHGVRHVAAMSPPLDADLEATVAGIALDVPEAEDEPRGQIVSFDRTGSGTAKQSASPPQPTAAEPHAEQTEPEEPEEPSAHEDTAEDTVEATDDIPAEETSAHDTAHPENAGKPATEELAQPDPADSTSGPDDAETDGDPAAQQDEPDDDADAAQPADTPGSHAGEAAEDESPVADDLAASVANAGGDAAGAAAASSRVVPIDVPDDPPDTTAAPPSALSMLAGIQRTSARNAAQYADARARLTDLRQRIAGGRKSS